MSRHGNPCNANAGGRRKLRARFKARRDPCAICGRPIDYELPAFDEWSFELDEIKPRRLGGDPLDPDNVQPTHRRCNREKYLEERRREREARLTPPDPPRASRRW